MLNGNHYDGTDVNFISCKVGRDSNESLNANWLENPPFFVVSLLFPFATYIFSLSFFIYSPFFHEYKSSPISERNLLIFNQIIIMYICLIRGKKYKGRMKWNMWRRVKRLFCCTTTIILCVCISILRVSRRSEPCFPTKNLFAHRKLCQREATSKNVNILSQS